MSTVNKLTPSDFHLAPAPNARRLRWIVVAIFGFALAIRLTSITALLPAVFHPDEPTNETVILRIARTPTASPRFFRYPSVFLYVEAGIARAFELVSQSHVEPARIASSGNVRVRSPGFWTAARSTTAVLGAGIAAMAAWLVGSLTGLLPAAALGGLFTALSPILVDDSRLMTPDTYAAFFSMATILAASKIATTETVGWRMYALSGVLVGLAGGSKYNAAIVAVSVVVAHFARAGLWRGLRDPRLLVLAGVCAVVTFLLTTPFAILDYARFKEDLRFEAHHYQTGHPGATGNSFVFNVRALWESEGARLCLLALLGFLRAGPVRRGAAVTGAFVLVYGTMISVLPVHFIRNLVPVLGPLLVLVGLGVGAAGARVAKTMTPARFQAMLVGVAVLLSVGPASSIVATTKTRHFNPRAAAAAWVASHLPPGSRVAVEPYGPWVDPDRFRVMAIQRFGESPARELDRLRAQYVIVAEGSYGRYYADRTRFARQVARYESLFLHHCEVARFKEAPGAEIRVIDLRCKPAVNVPLNP